MDVSEADLDHPVQFDKVPTNDFRRMDQVDANIVSTLKSLSTERVDKSDDFQKLVKNITRYEDQKAKREVPLSEAKFLARRAELDADEEDEKTFEEQANANDEVFKRNFYNNEALNITVDYLRLLGKDKVAKADPPGRVPN